MVCLGLEPAVAGRLAQTNPLSHSDTNDSFPTNNWPIIKIQVTFGQLIVCQGIVKLSFDYLAS